MMIENMIEKGQLVFLEMDENKEAVGIFDGVKESGAASFIKLDRAAQIVVVPQQTPQGVLPTKVILNAEDQGNFGSTLLVNCDKVITIKTLKESGKVYSMYIQATTGIIPPPMSGIPKLN